tara:strand:- start:203 stop:379 length:177 start_codon:yes stop_codon:yes gene_type:complete
MIRREDVIFGLTEELHNDVAAIYEAVVDQEDKVAFDLIDELRRKLKMLKDNLIKKEGL